ncbi:MAG: zinc-dependent peptidase [Bdellovibrionales bacterium]|nr:zinc-dependent peptidase [Bdellovibrionales bacterium]
MFFKKWRRRALLAQPFPQAWQRILDQKVPYYQVLPEADKQELRGHITVFLDEKHFEGAGGLTLTEEMKVVVAAQACVLLLHRKTDYYPTLSSIILYPSSYQAPHTVVLPGGVVAEDPQARLGESWGMGAVVLAWDNVLQSARNIHDGRNLVFHEFAHQLDEEDGTANGRPVLRLKTQYAEWAKVLSGEFEVLGELAAEHKKTLIDPYGAANPAEFFAVITETFFEKPIQLRDKHPQLYTQLKLFYQQDPAQLFQN